MVSLLILIAIALSALAEQLTDISLSSSFTKSDRLEGSTEGGTKLFFKGDWGWAKTYDFEIKIGDSACFIEESYDKIKDVSCTTPPSFKGKEGAQPITVLYLLRPVNFATGVDSTFHYIESATSKITAVVPPEATPGDSIQFVGVWTGDDVTDIVESRVGGKLTNIKETGALGKGIEVTLGDNVHWDGNPTLRFVEGDTANDWRHEQTNLKGDLYKFRTLSRVDYISRHKGGNLGGLDVEILGEGFPTHSHDVTVEIFGNTCQVTLVEYTRIHCLTGPEKINNEGEHKYEGGAGLRLKIWSKQGDVEELLLADNPDSESIVANPAYFSNTNPVVKHLYEGYFVAPYTGDYIFFVNVAGTADVLLGTQEDIEEPKPIISGAVYSETFFSQKENQSKPISLVAGKKYHIKAIFQSSSAHASTDSSHFFLGVQTPSGGRLNGNEMPLVQRAEIKDKEYYEAPPRQYSQYSIQLYTKKGEVEGGSIRFRVNKKIVTEYINSVGSSWLCEDIEKVLFNAKVKVSCQTYREKGVVYIDLIPDNHEHNVYEVDTAKANPKNQVLVKVSEKKLTEQHKPVEIQYVLHYDNKESSPFELTTAAWKLQKQFNDEIPSFRNELRVVQDGAYLYFLLPGDHFKDGVIFIRIQVVAGHYKKEAETLDIVQKPGDYKFWWTIPSDFLRTREEKSSLRVWVDGSLAICRGSCDFFYLPAHEITFSKDKGILTVEGAKLIQDALEQTITVGGVDCPIEYLAPGIYKCTLSPGEAGKHQPVVRDSYLGFLAIHKDEKDTIDFDLVIEKVDPSVGGSKGGTYLTIRGSGFPANLERAKKNASVHVGDSPCEIDQSSINEIVCITSAKTTDNKIKVVVNDVRAYSDLFEYSDKYNVEIADIEPKTASTLYPTILTITGKNFGTEKKDLKVKIGSEECYVQSVINSKIICKLLGGPKGFHRVVVYRDRIGSAFVDKYPLVFKVTAISHNEGSIYGGTQVTITGAHFSTTPRAHRVMIERDLDCLNIRVVNNSTITCTVPPMPTRGAVANVPYKFEVIGRLTEIADCFCECTFIWSTYRSPRVDSIEPKEGQAGTIVTLTGQYFGDYDLQVSLFFGDVKAEIISVEDNKIVAKVPAVQGNNPVIKLYIADRGDGKVNATFFNKVVVTKVSPAAVSQAGGVVKIEGSGFHDKQVITFGGLPCTITSVKNSSVDCSLASYSADENFKDLAITDDKQTFSCADTSVCAIKFLASATPRITGISAHLTIQGSFLADIKTAGGQVTLGTFPCIVTVSSVSSIQCSPQVPAGSYPVNVYIPGYGFAAGSVSYVVALQVNSVSEVISSYAGGQNVTLSGLALVEANRITVCGRSAQIISANGASTIIQTPALPTSYSQAEFTIAFDEVALTGVTNIASNPALAAQAFDRNQTTFYSDGVEQKDKWIGVDAGVGNAVLLRTIDVVPGGVGKRKYRELSGSEVQGSSNCVDYIKLFTFDHVDDIKNKFTYKGKQAYRCIRVFKAQASGDWAINEINITGARLVDDLSSEQKCDIVVTAPNGERATLNKKVTYTPSSTPTLTEIKPKLGSGDGGQKVTFTGSGFGSNVNNVSVEIDDVPCKVTSVSDYRIECITGARRFYQDPNVQIFIKDKGFVATAGLTYLYAELWSDPRTWGGVSPPSMGESAYIAPGQVVILDTSTPVLTVITVEGTLIVADIPGIIINTEILYVHQGKLIIGTEDEPYTNNLSLIFHGGVDTAAGTIFGNKMLLALTGSVDIHGIPRKPTWTFLAYSASKGDSFIEVAEDVDWNAGEHIVIAPTGYDHTQGEKRKITKAQGRRLFLDRPLDYSHYSAIEKFDNEKADLRCEVGLLSRNIKVLSGEQDLKQRLYGTQFLIGLSTGPVEGRFSYIEFFKAGQAFHRFKYPLHFHLAGALTDSFVRGNSFHETHNRAIVVHGTAYAKIEDNVAYDIMGHAYFLEEGSEIKNLFRNNLGIYVKPSQSRLNTDRTPAIFFIANPDNFIYDNHAAGSAFSGFWYDAPVNPPIIGFGAAPRVLCIQFQEIGGFRGNVAHSNGRHGLRIEPRQIPVTNPCQPVIDRTKKDWWTTNPANTAYFTDFTSYKNKESGAEIHEVGDIRFTGFKLLDNLESGIQIAWTNFSEPFNSVRISNALIVGKTKNNKEVISGFVGIKTPQTDGLLVEDVRFYNIESTNYPLGDSLFSELPRVADYGARVHKLSKLKFVNSNSNILWNVPYRGIYEVLDGSLTGKAGDFVVAEWNHLKDAGCKYQNSLSSLVCKNKVRRVHLYQPTPIKDFVNRQIKVALYSEGRTNEYTSLPMVTTDQKKDIKYSWALPLVTGNAYNVHWCSRPINFDSLKIEIDTFEADEFVILRFNQTDVRQNYTVRRGVRPTGVTPDPTIIQRVERDFLPTDPAGTYKWGPGYFDIFLSGRAANQHQFNDIEITAYSCQEQGCNQFPLLTAAPAVPETVRKWSDASQWPNSKVPKSGDHVVIPQNHRVILDGETADLKHIEINGVLEFDSKSNAKLASHTIFVRAGTLRSGSADVRSNKTHVIELLGDEYSTDFVLGQGIDPGNKVLVNTGKVELYGLKAESVVRLEQNAHPGEDFIFVGKNSWQKKDYIVIAPTGFSNQETDEAKIVDIIYNVKDDYDWKKKQQDRGFGKGERQNYSSATVTPAVKAEDVVKLKLDRKLDYYHAGEDIIVGDKTIDMRAEVAELQRNVKIVGSKDWQCSILTTSFVDSNVEGAPVTRSGTLVLDGVEIRNCGQIDSEKAALRFERNTAGRASVTNSVINFPAGYGLFIRGANNVHFEHNAIVGPTWRGIVVLSTQSSKILSNVIIGTKDRGYAAPEEDKNAAFYGCIGTTDCTATQVRNNRAAGYSFAGFIYSTSLCNVENLFTGNVAHSGYVGWIIANPQGLCLNGTHFSAYFNTLGVGSVTQLWQVVLSDLRLVENRVGLGIRQGVTWNQQIPAYLQQNLTSSVFVGQTQHSHCDPKECESLDCQQRTGFYTGFGDYIPTPISYTNGVFVPLTKQRGSSHGLGIARYTKIHVQNFAHSKKCKTSQFAFETNPEVSDYIMPHFLSQFVKVNVEVDSLVYMHAPDPDLVTPTECGNFVCTGLLNVLIEDTDGSVIGDIGGAILPNNPGIANKEVCKFFDKNNAFICNYQKDQKDHYQVYIYEENTGENFTTSPFNVTSYGNTFKSHAGGGYRNDLNAFNDHLYEGEAKQQLRVRRFPAVVWSGLHYNVTFTGNQAIDSRQYLQGLNGRSGEITVTQDYLDNRAHDFSLNSFGVPDLNTLFGDWRHPNIKDPHGYYRFYQNDIKTTVVMQNELFLQLTASGNIKVESGLNYHLNDYAQNFEKYMFVDVVAMALQINPYLVKIPMVNVTAPPISAAQSTTPNQSTGAFTGLPTVLPVDHRVRGDGVPESIEPGASRNFGSDAAFGGVSNGNTGSGTGTGGNPGLAPPGVGAPPSRLLTKYAEMGQESSGPTAGIWLSNNWVFAAIVAMVLLSLAMITFVVSKSGKKTSVMQQAEVRG